jgi:hypothetical protein
VSDFNLQLILDGPKPSWLLGRGKGIRIGYDPREPLVAFEGSPEVRLSYDVSTSNIFIDIYNTSAGDIMSLEAFCNHPLISPFISVKESFYIQFRGNKHDFMAACNALVNLSDREQIFWEIRAHGK